MDDKEDEVWLSTEQAASILGIRASTVWNYARQRRVKAKFEGNRWWISQDSALAYAEKAARPPKPKTAKDENMRREIEALFHSKGIMIDVEMNDLCPDNCECDLDLGSPCRYPLKTDAKRSCIDR